MATEYIRNVSIEMKRKFAMFFTPMIAHGSPRVWYDMAGKMIREIELPGVGNAGGFGGKRDEKTWYLSEG